MIFNFLSFSGRSTSGRISSRSTSATPKFSSKPSMHSSSADLHTSSGSRSSGSHILDSNHTPGSGISRDHSGIPHSAMRVESVDVHSDSSMSGSRSLNSPRLEHGLSLDQDVIEAVNARTGGAMTDEEDEEDNSRGGSESQVQDGLSHVSSETKGAQSPPPELSSPVRYIGIYSEAASPFYPGDGFVAYDADAGFSGGCDVARAVSSADFDKEKDVSQLPPLGAGQSSAPPSVCVGSESKADSSVVSLLSDDDLSNQTLKANLDLKLTDSVSVSSISTTVDHNHPQPVTSSLTRQHHTKSSVLPDAFPLHTTRPVCTTPSVCIATSPSNTTNISVSVSQNANDQVNEKAFVSVKSHSEDAVGSNSVSVKSPHVYHDFSSKLPESSSVSKKVSPTDSGQQHWQNKQDTDMSAPYSLSSPLLPLSSQYSEVDLKRSLDVSPSSCVTDIAQSRQDQKVRLSSRVSSLDSTRSSPVSDVREKSTLTPSPHLQQESENGINQILEKESEAVAPSSVNNIAVSEESSETKESVSDREFKKLPPSGEIVEAALPVKDQLEAGQGVSRKLSAGTDLIEDIPYILHRRLDGQKEETAVFKVSEADKIKKQRSASPGVKGGALSCFQQKQMSVIDHISSERPLSPESSLEARAVVSSATGKAGGDDLKSRPLLEKSPPLNKRYEFVNVHRLPAKTSYSSVDDTTSPSGDQGILKQLEQGAVIRLDAPKNPETPVLIASTALSSELDTHPETQSTASVVDVEVGSSDQEPVMSEHETAKPPSPEHAQVNCEQTEVAAAVEQHIPTSEVVVVSKDSSLKQLVSDTDLNGVQFYSPKIPGVQKLQMFSSTSTSEDSSETAAATTAVQASTSSSTSSENVSDMVFENTGAKPKTHLQYFEISKPEPCRSGIISDGALSSLGQAERDVPRSLPLGSGLMKPQVQLGTSGKHVSTNISFGGNGGGFHKNDTEVKDLSGSAFTRDGKPYQHRVMFLSSAGRSSTSSTSSNSDSQFLIDLPSPAAALFYSDNDSPPTLHTEAGAAASALTFSTFRPDPAEEAFIGEESSKIKSCRWSLHNVEEDEESADFKIIMTEGIVEKSALKKRTLDDMDKPKEPKRVSWHEDSDIQHSYHSDLSMTAQRSPVDECDVHLFGEVTTSVDSGSILETLENLRRQNSESDMTSSGSSDISSGDSDMEVENNPKQVYFQYAASKGFCPSVDGTMDSGVGGMSEGGRSQGHEASPLESLERLGSMDGSGSSFGGMRFKMQDELMRPNQDSSPLEPLERLYGLSSDNSDDEGEADDEDDEPNFPPPPPILDIPEEMLMSYESDLPLPDVSVPSLYSQYCLEGTSSSFGMPTAMTYSSDSESENRVTLCGTASFRVVRDPLASLEFGDIVGDRNYTTSESESDFDVEEANLCLRRMSASSIKDATACDVRQRSFSETKKRSLGSKNTFTEVKKIPEKPEVLPKPKLAFSQSMQEAHQSGQPSIQRSQALPAKSWPQQPTLQISPKPHPPPVHPKPGSFRQPQMGKGHFERTRHKSSSSSSSSSEPRPHHHPHS